MSMFSFCLIHASYFISFTRVAKDSVCDFICRVMGHSWQQALMMG